MLGEDRNKSGRTTRMYEEAARLCREGRDVILVIEEHNPADVEYRVMDHYLKEGAPDPNKPAGSMTIQSLAQARLNLFTMRPDGLDRNKAVLVDHHVCARVLHELKDEYAHHVAKDKNTLDWTATLAELTLKRQMVFAMMCRYDSL